MRFVRPVVATVGGVGQGVRDLGRLREVVQVLVRHGLGILVAGVSIPGVPRAAPTFASSPDRALVALQELGPTFVKLGQVLSTRPDLLPEAYCRAFESLQDDADELPFSEITATLVHAFGPEWRAAFDRFDERPLATASMAQVHRATLPDGRDVVVKVQRSGIARTIRADLNILNVIARALVSEFPELRSFDPRGILIEFERSITAELDFVREADHTERFRVLFAGDPRVRIPEVVRALTRPDVLCLEYLDGIPIRLARESGCDMPLVGENYLTVAYDMLFVHGFFHGDLHPGNVLVLPGGQLGLLDFGMVGRLTREMRTNLLTIFVAVDRGDHRTVARLFYEIAIKDRRVDYQAVERETLEILERNLQTDDMSEIHIGKLITDLTHAAARQGARVPLAYTMFFKALLTSEGLARTLLYEQNPIAAAKPYFHRMLAETFSEDSVRQELLYQGISLASLGKRVPITISQLVEDLDTQRLTLNVRDDVGRRAADLRTDRLLLAAFAITAFGVGTATPYPWVMGMAYVAGALLALATWLAGRRARQAGQV